MNIKSVYEKVHYYFNPKPQLIEQTPSRESINAVVAYYQKRYWWWLILYRVFSFAIPGKGMLELFGLAAENFVEGLVGIGKLLLSIVSAVALVVAFPILLLWGILSYCVRFTFRGIMKAYLEDCATTRAARRNADGWGVQEKKNVCGVWRFTAVCLNDKNIPDIDGFANGDFSYSAAEDAKKHINTHVAEHCYSGEIDTYSCVISSKDFTLTFEYKVKTPNIGPAFGSDEV